jgi:hypothetical protein
VAARRVLVLVARRSLSDPIKVSPMLNAFQWQVSLMVVVLLLHTSLL